MKNTLICLMVFVALLEGTATAGADCRADGLPVVLPRYRAEAANIVEALMLLGRDTHICFGFRGLDRSAFATQVQLNLTGASVGQVISAVLKGVSGYSFEQSSHGIVLIKGPAQVAAGSLLDYAISTYAVPHTSLKTASNALKLQLMADLNPTIEGFAGSYAAGDVADLIGPMEVRGRPVEEILNVIVSASKGAMWLETVPDTEADRVPPQGLWTIIEYTESRDVYLPLLSAIAQSFPEKRPKP